ncbi:hypothetical protein GCM10010350_81120 [Streptomyces galilaeus]|uniref:helix-turn-helix domain-containing protein n=1 Tax=Streptomyces galilaeus TaxID=33899 RepID=UPI00199B5CA8|nr:winged helix-turn-helix domain-containing protein [Streptomyces galilaeus]GGW84163.1 hypothetical protein GCM10010350_81120 [Streptomyces galilaeus]
MERLSSRQWERLERELKRGPLAHGWDEFQGWTLKRVKLLIGRMFHVGYTIQGVWKLLRRHGSPAAGAPAAGDRTRRRGDRGVEGRGVAAGNRTAVDLGASGSCTYRTCRPLFSMI